MAAQPCVIDGEFVGTDDTLDVLDPSTRSLLDRTARGTAEHIDAAVAAARSATYDWRHTPTRERSAILRRIAQALRGNRDELALLESRDTGKPLTQARADADVAARYFEYYEKTIGAFFGRRR